MKDVGVYGTNYVQRALTTAVGLGANRPQDAIYPISQKDTDGHEYDAGSKKYVMHFNKSDLPPVNGFWSITMYDKDYFFVPNSLNRYCGSSELKTPVSHGVLIPASRTLSRVWGWRAGGRYP